MTLVELMVVVAIIGLLASVAMPNFMKFQARSKQAEARTNLRAIFSGERSRFAERDMYSPNIGEIGFAPERGNRYSYDLGSTAAPFAPLPTAGIVFACTSMRARVAGVEGPGVCGVSADVFRYNPSIVAASAIGRSPVLWAAAIAANANLPADSTGVNSASCPTCDFAAHAIGNVDNDPGADELFIGSQFGSMAPSACAEGGQQLQPGQPVNVHSDVDCYD